MIWVAPSANDGFKHLMPAQLMALMRHAEIRYGDALIRRLRAEPANPATELPRIPR